MQENMVIPIILYCSETWAISAQDKLKIERFEISCLIIHRKNRRGYNGLKKCIAQLWRNIGNRG